MRKRTLVLGTLALSVAFATSITTSGMQTVEPQRPGSQDQDSASAQTEADIELNADNYAAWRDHIQPDLSELAWEEIPWRTTFKDGLTAADVAGKPLLLWAMNGHPLGCT